MSINTPGHTFAAGWNMRCNTGPDNREETPDWREGWQKCDKAFRFGQKPAAFNVMKMSA